MIILFFVILVIAALVIFSVQNANPVIISFVLWRFNASLAIVVFLALVAGMIIMAIVSLGMRCRKREKVCAVTGERVPPGDGTAATRT